MAHKDETMPPADAGPVELVLGPWCRSETGDVLLCTNARCGWIGRCLVAEPLEAGDERDCQHGQLARACDRCADAREIAELREALTEIRDRIKAHPAYADLTEAEEIETGGDTAELSYLARVADAALGPNAEVSGCLRAPMPEDAQRTAAGSPLDRPVGPVAGA